MRTTVRTVNGNSLDLLNPQPDQVHIEDLAHHLAQQNRYNGGCPFPFSVAQHSLLVARLLPDHLKLYGLLHDAAEAYLGDLVSPAKRIPQLGQVFKPIEYKIQNAVFLRFGLDPWVDYTPIKEADKAIQAVEKARLNGWPDLVAMDRLPDPAAVEIIERDWKDVRREYLDTFHELYPAQVAA